MNEYIQVHKGGAAPWKGASLYGFADALSADRIARLRAVCFARAVCRSAVRYCFARQYLYRLIVSRLARAGVIMSGALTPIDVL